VKSQFWKTPPPFRKLAQPRMLLSAQQRSEIHRRMEAAAEHLRLPFRSRAWRGQSGNWLGAGVGSSIDFQDHRPYLPGDDPRYIDWQAYARTGHYAMKLYREEVSPLVDLVLDVSASMFIDQSKAIRTLELFYFCIESARHSAASLHCFAADGESLRALTIEQAVATDDFLSGIESCPPNLARVPWRQGSLRILLSDLLFSVSPDALLAMLSSGKGRGLIFVPFSREESSPIWSGNIALTDCETRRRRIQSVTADLMGRYAQNYRRHFSLWREHARKHAVVIARVESDPGFREAVHVEALPTGAMEFC
jgi:uncharacterized protein (DUF58 family)